MGFRKAAWVRETKDEDNNIACKLIKYSTQIRIKTTTLEKHWIRLFNKTTKRG